MEISFLDLTFREYFKQNLIMEIRLAKITVQNILCDTCILFIKKRLKQIHNIQSMQLCRENSTLVFSFTSANQLSNILNTLTAMGYPEQGDKITTESLKTPFCNCNVQELVKAS